MLHRQRILWLAALIAIASPATVSGQDGGWMGALGGGPSVPLGNLADEARRGYHVQGSVGYALDGLPITVRADLFYQLFRNVARDPGLHVSLGGEWFRQLNGQLSMMYRLPLGSIEPYALAGVGWGHEWHGDRTFNGTRHGNLIVNSGVGVAFPILGMSGFVEARLANLLGGEALPLNPPAVRDEVTFRSLPITFGVMF